VATTMQVGDIINITMVGRCNGQTTMTSLHYRLTSVGSLTVHSTWAQAVISKLNTATVGLAQYYMNACSEQLIAAEWWVQKIYPTRMVKVSGVSDPSEGVIAEFALPPATSVSLTKRGLVAGRHSIGGVRMPAVPLTWNESGYVSATGLLLYESLCSQLQAPLDGVTIGNLQPVIFNRVSPNISVDVMGMSTEDTLRTMKRRVVGRGI